MQKDAARASHEDELSHAGTIGRHTTTPPLARRLVESFSHDVRTPLTVIREFAAIMGEGLGGPTTNKQREYLATIIARSDDLSLAIDDLLDASALQAGALALWRRAIPPSEIIDRVRTAIDSRLQARGVALKTAVDAALPAVYCDANKIVRAIVNLTVRVLKRATAGDRMLISATSRDRRREVAFQIADWSASASAAKRPASGKPNQRFHSTAATSAADDFDLSLYIARELVRVNLGSFLAERKGQRVSETTVALPAAEPLSLFGRYLEFVQANANDTPRSPASISLMMAEIDEGVEAKLLSAADGFLQTAIGGCELCYRLDERHWISAVRRRPQRLGRLLDRIERRWKDLGRGRPAAPLPELRLEAIGSWRVDRERAELVRAFAAMVGPCIEQCASERG
jgi:hypothetical protein